MGNDISVAVYKFGDKIFIGNADNLFDRVTLLFDDNTVTTVVFDLENVRLCDSYGLKMFLNCQRKAEKAGKKLLLYRPDPILRDTIFSTRLEQVFNIVDTLE